MYLQSRLCFMGFLAHCAPISLRSFQVLLPQLLSQPLPSAMGKGRNKHNAHSPALQKIKEVLFSLLHIYFKAVIFSLVCVKKIGKLSWSYKGKPAETNVSVEQQGCDSGTCSEQKVLALFNCQ